MKKQVVENQVMKLCSKCGNVKIKTHFFRNNKQNKRSECLQCSSVKEK